MNGLVLEIVLLGHQVINKLSPNFVTLVSKTLSWLIVLAKSSRNTYLSADERKSALVLSQSLALAEKMINDGEKDTSKLKEAMTTFIEKEPLAKIDYVEFVDWKTLEPVSEIERPVLNAIAVYIGKTRLIDNHIYE
ncbi:pantoate--beta-alanine ligase [Streptococcus infantarius subsp. infantarius]|nr:pantoate--beta-alanine ligase [Streptococcus infantarius subsp. infantarius]MCO4490400.1 pantoate--beta-alanine ligase [Streptococcus infantarius subsp. infantarius]MCO4492723.1 pantoate--beta-alanine ligase [Streptococcus infantarius subsp. infantarius]MCO4508203.1 pantoate--beta-alanine ligase [Streptococcus infantarius subsp. infantarius]MCO4508926.1 pantoate--beta-alanine ligase [Streptococcus infantarius subsp. infantarius]